MLQCRYIYVKLSCFSYLFKFSTALYCEQHSCIFFFFFFLSSLYKFSLNLNVSLFREKKFSLCLLELQWPYDFQNSANHRLWYTNTIFSPLKKNYISFVVQYYVHRITMNNN